ncbi:hypothetical protein MKW94_006804 [Papaver nudicaule]|uniref:Uncharacterized protein n=1 Tax=Papaver nudicaule TaxID=74823 RepID=A0AA41S4C8_PAPNU|nr:hypothetical protein [Papaver nudicaule]
MQIIRKPSHGFFTCSSVFTILVCLIVSTERAAAWKSMCKPGDVYIDSTNDRPSGTTCQFCENECIEECSDLNLSPISYSCLARGDILCKCCFLGVITAVIPTKSSPSSSPSPPTLLPLPDSEFSGPWPHDYNICQPNEKYLSKKHRDGMDCVKRSSCEKSCTAEGLWLTRAECVAGGRAFANPSFQWYEQCCCGKVKPSPPPPSPPPPFPSPPPPSPPPPPPPSPPPPSPSPPPPTPPVNICRAGEAYVPTQVTSCSFCTARCRSECSARGARLTKTGCYATLCKCCCKSLTLPSSTPDSLATQ